MRKSESNRKTAIVVYIPFGWNDQRFWHRRKPTEALAVPLQGKGAVLVVEPYICPTTGWYRGAERARLYQSFRWGRMRQEAKNLYVLTPTVWITVGRQDIQWIKTFNQRKMSRQIRKTVRRILPDVQNVISWFYRPEHADFVGLAAEDFVVFECYDQYHLAPAVRYTPVKSERVKNQVRKLLSKTDIVITTSEELRKEYVKLHPKIYFFLNGSDVKFFSKVQESDTKIAEPINQLKYPILGFLGNINQDIDVDLLWRIAERKRNWTFLMAGNVNKDMMELEIFQRFKNLPNVHLVGWIREEVPNYFKAVDVCLIPFRTDSPFNQYRNPNKLYEYMAMGKPVVSTDLSGVSSCSDVIYIAHSREDFISCIERAINEDRRELIIERMRRAKETSWEKRAEKIIELVLKDFENVNGNLFSNILAE